MAGEGYRGTQALNVPIPGRLRSRELVLVALDHWEHGVELRGTATVDRDDPFWLPRAWQLGTDQGTVHRSRGGGGTSKGWSESFEPALPASARELLVFVGSDGERPRPDLPVPDEPAVVVALPAVPLAVHRARATLDEAARPDAYRGRRPSLEDGSVRPDGVVAVGALLDEVAGRDIVVPSIERFPTWFMLHLAGSGGLTDLSSGRSTGGLGALWTVEDDRGGRYEGTFGSAHSGFPWMITASFSPALDPEATELALAFPNPFGPGIVHTRFGLP